MKYRLIEAEKSEHRISRLCKVLGVTRQGYYAWRRLKLPAEYLIFAALLLILPTSGGLIVSMGRFGMDRA